ncbi:hypothetical protein OGAPHI_006387 [Ogataea philodendri]|uniref:Uncharacterized protein n=1 Tax=Ogataea philodendri TaxID=1378263 RepID=A0A9P8NY17_9ASCO|nr:uncharacterized protein OGAPHI_006387 [Ogataea philodendri]KAH3661539.1 hypothetical protein OGAPHI_006387 [Ogataea philodendri]
MVQLFVVHPDLQVSDCNDCPSQNSLDKKKGEYIKNLKYYKRLTAKLSHNADVAQVPNYCLTRNTEQNVNDIIHSAEKMDDGSDDDKPTLDDVHELSHLPLSSMQISEDDFTKQGTTRVDSMSLEEKLELPANLDSRSMDEDTNNFLALKYLQIITDLSLVEYKYLQSYSKINESIKKYFSMPELTSDLEEEGCTVVSNEMEFFKKLELLLKRSRELKSQFEEKYLLPRQQVSDLIHTSTHPAQKEAVR